MTISNRQGQRRNSTYHEHFKSLSHTLLASMRLGKRRYLEREGGKKRKKNRRKRSGGRSRGGREEKSKIGRVAGQTDEEKE